VNRIATPSLFIRLQFPGGDRFGPGKADLLEAIDRTGSISEAARTMRMSYRRAWLLVDGTNKLFGKPVVTAGPGGRQGGGARLTAFGRAVHARYRRLTRAITKAAASDLAQFSRWAARLA
jgi:molybdate transport system regulatory protein